MAAEDLLTLSEAKEALRVGDEDVSLDPELVRLITAASRLIDTHFGAMVNRTITAELHDNPRSGLLRLRRSPVSSITSVSVDGTALSAGSYQVVKRGYDEWLARTAGYQMTPWMSVRLQGISVTYVAGRYASTAAVPALVKEAAVAQCRHWWRPTQHGVSESEGFGVPLAIQQAGVAPGVKGMLAEFYRAGLA